jgi:tRNA-splicing ligase RtcB
MKLKVLEDLGKPYAIYADSLDGGTIEQFVSAMEHDAVMQGALMADAHLGYSLPIGGCCLTSAIIFPSFVGYDIGCGVSTIQTTFSAEDIQKNSERIFDALYEAIPTGVGKESARPVSDKRIEKLRAQKKSKVAKTHFESKGLKQLNNLGSGNHFLEAGISEDGIVFITVHSGSRNLGHSVASHYMKIASGSDKPKEGVFGLEAKSDGGQAYLADMHFCTEYATLNRDLMLDAAVGVISDILGADPAKAVWSGGMRINKAHNFIEVTPDGSYLHRKGATIASKGTLGVIPGNMRDGVFVVEGLGNANSLESCSHGAGRLMSRAKAKEAVDLVTFQESMEGIKAKVTQGTLDESPFAYKDIFNVMALQSDLAKVLFHIKPLINIKG